MTRRRAVTANAGTASATAATSRPPDRVAAERAFLEGQVARMEAKAARAREALDAAEAALTDARSQLAAFSGDADG